MRTTALFCGAAAALAPAAALPCSPDFSAERYTPTGTSTVPANAKLQFVGPMPTLLTLQVGPLAGPLVDVTPREIPDQSLWGLSNVVQVDLPPIASGTTARVLVDHDFAPPMEILVTPNAPADSTPPTATGPLRLFPSYRPGDTCVPSAHFAVSISATAVSDDVALANATVYETTGGTMRPLSSAAAVDGASFNAITAFVPPQPSGERCFALVVRDLAGNESAPLGGCADLQASMPDAGPAADAGDPVDGGVPPDGGAATDAGAGAASADEDGGCTCARPREASGALGVVALGLVLAARRRRGARVAD